MSKHRRLYLTSNPSVLRNHYINPPSIDTCTSHAEHSHCRLQGQSSSSPPKARQNHHQTKPSSALPSMRVRAVSRRAFISPPAQQRDGGNQTGRKTHLNTGTQRRPPNPQNTRRTRCRNGSPAAVPHRGACSPHAHYTHIICLSACVCRGDSICATLTASHTTTTTNPPTHPRRDRHGPRRGAADRIHLTALPSPPSSLVLMRPVITTLK